VEKGGLRVGLKTDKGEIRAGTEVGDRAVRKGHEACRGSVPLGLRIELREEQHGEPHPGAVHECLGASDGPGVGPAAPHGGCEVVLASEDKAADAVRENGAGGAGRCSVGEEPIRVAEILLVPGAGTDQEKEEAGGRQERWSEVPPAGGMGEE